MDAEAQSEMITKAQEDCPACKQLRDKIRTFLTEEHVADFESGHRNMDMSFAEEVPNYRKDCESIAAAFDTLRSALGGTEKDEGG